ncbi:MAG: RICIN domain-containing protein [Thermoanaerobaculia bacterium]
MISVGGLTLLATASPLPAQAVTAMSTEAFLNTLGVNTHINPYHPVKWDIDPVNVGRHMAYIGVRNQRDWPYKADEGADFLTVQSNWSPLGRLWTSIAEDNQTDQRNDLSYAESIYTTYGPGLVYVLGGPNEEDADYPQGVGTNHVYPPYATLPDSALVQGQLYTWAHSQGRNVKVNQMDFGAGWTSMNNWQGDYNPRNTGITILYPERGNQNYTPGGADIGSAHTYISNGSQTELTVLNIMRANALLTTPGKPVAHTEAGIYKYTGYPPTVAGAMTVVGAFDSAAAGDAGYLVYGLQDDDTYGFYDSTDTYPNPMATYYHNMTTILASTSGTYGPGQPPTFTPGSLNVTYSNTTTAAHLLMQKPTGEYVIADWHEVLMDGTQTSQTRATDTITFGQTFATVKVYDVEIGTTPIATLSNVSSYTLTLNPCDMYLLVLTPAAGGPVTDLIPDGTYIIGNRSNGNIASMATANIGAGIIQGQPGSLDTTWTVTNLGNNVVKITNVGVGGVMGCVSVGVNGGLVDQTDTGVTSQQWTVTQPVPGWFTLTSRAGPFVADIYSGLGTQLLLETANGGTTQQWSFTPANLIPDGTYIIGNRSNGNIASMATANIGAGIIQGQPGSLDTAWTVTNLGNNVVKIKNVGVSGVMGSDNGGGLVAQADTGVTSQQWTVTQPAPGWFTLTSKAGPFVADIYSGLGTQLLLETADGGTTQQWSFMLANLIPDGNYTIANKSTGFIASMATANIGAGIIQGQPGSLDTTWTVANLGNNVVKITNVGVGGVMGCTSVAANGGLVAQSDTGVTSQQWTVTQPAPGWFTLSSRAGAFVADIYSGLGTQLLLEPANGGATQQWSFH